MGTLSLWGWQFWAWNWKIDFLYMRNRLFIYEKWQLYSCRWSAAPVFPVYLIFLFYPVWQFRCSPNLWEMWGVIRQFMELAELGWSFKYYMKCYFKFRSHITNSYLKMKDMAVLCIMTPHLTKLMGLSWVVWVSRQVYLGLCQFLCCFPRPNLSIT